MRTEIEYRVVPVTRFIVTRHEREATDDGSQSTAGSSSQRGEYDNAETAHAVGYALAKAEHEMNGWPPGDPRMTYPAPYIKPGVIGGAATASCTFRQPQSA